MAGAMLAPEVERRGETLRVWGGRSFERDGSPPRERAQGGSEGPVIAEGNLDTLELVLLVLGHGAL